MSVPAHLLNPSHDEQYMGIKILLDRKKGARFIGKVRPLILIT